MKKITYLRKIALSVLFFLISVLSYSQSQTFNMSGTFTVPVGVTTVTVQAWGGGGRGSMLTSNLGGGAYANKVLALISGNTYTVTVGNGSSSTASGGDSWFISAATVLAKGGSSAADGSTGGSAAGSIGDIGFVFSGGKGANGLNGSYGGGGGSSAGNSTNGNAASNQIGAFSPIGGGNGGDGRHSSQGNGLDGISPGGAGDGALRTSSSTRNGENSANGQVLLSLVSPEINISGNAVNIVDGDITPTAADWTDFGSTDINGLTFQRIFTIQNTGSATLTLGAITISGANAGDFTVTAVPSPSVAIGGNSTFAITFNPSAAGIRAATISIVNNDSNENPYNYSIQGTGTEQEIDIQGNSISIADGDITPSILDSTDFGSVDINTGSTPINFTIVNTGTSPLTIGALSFSGLNSSDFTLTAAPSSPIAAGGSTFFTVTFNPSATGIRTAAISIVNNDSTENPYNFSIQGIGTEQEINIQGNSVSIVDGDITPAVADWTDFSTVASTRTFTIQNTGTSALTLGAISFIGVNAADFSILTAPVSPIVGGGSTTFVIKFTPTSIGVKTATFNIINNDSNENPYNFSIQGTGVAQEINVQGNAVSITDGDITPQLADWTDFGSTDVIGGTTTRTFTIQNSGNMNLTIGAITISGPNAADFTVTTLPNATIGLGSTTFVVTFDPSAALVRTATISIVNNDATENPYNYSIRGTGNIPEMNLTGNLISIADGDITPSVSDNTDFGAVSVYSGSTTVTFTIQNTGTGNLNIGAITLSGPDASNYSIISLPNAVVPAGGATTFQVNFSPLTNGLKNATITIDNDDSNENPYDFALIGLGARAYPDTDADTVPDNIDIDDDNDGILDLNEEAECATYPLSNHVLYTFLNETFGTGITKGLINVNVPTATCTYCFEDGIAGTDTVACPSQSSWILDDGEYTVTYKIAGTLAADPENIHGDLAWNGLVDHTTGDTNGRMAVFNASYAPGIFYETAIEGVMPNIPITYSFWAMNILSQSIYPGLILPNITVEFLDTSNNILSTFNTGDIGRCNNVTTADNTCALSIWQQYTTSVNLGSNTNFIIRFKNNAPGGGGNDLAIDDITIKQLYSDTDGDGVANIFDLDSENDGIPDIEEAGFKAYSVGKGMMDLAGPTWVDANGNGMNDAIDAMISASTYVIPDTDGDGVKDYLDLDSDNDSIFDSNEGSLTNGDGDVNDDGLGDGPDTDGDGILNIFDTFVGIGTATRAFTTNTDALGDPDYMQLDSNHDGITDIAGTLYSSLDANSDGKIDGATDIDKDGILDSFDTATGAPGSPRDLDRKLYLDFDGRNDYGQSTAILGSLPAATLMAWINLSTTFSTAGFVAGQDKFQLRINSSKQVEAVVNGTTLTYTTILATGQWYHVGAAYGGGNLKVFLNGVVQTQALAGNIAADASLLTIGKDPLTSTKYFKGKIDEVRVFNVALTDLQLQRMIYQEIQNTSSQVRGLIVPADIGALPFANLLRYYRMDAYKNDIIDDWTTAGIDTGSGMKIYNNKNIHVQQAPMPFISLRAGNLAGAINDPTSEIRSMDIMDYNYGIVKVRHDITEPSNHTDLGMFVDPGITIVVNNDNKIQNDWYLKLDGKIDLQGKSQLVQSVNSILDASSAGYIERDQKGQSNKYNYNYWSSPVGGINAVSNNTSYTVDGMMKDATNPASIQNFTWTSSVDGAPTSPITLSNRWIYKFQNTTPIYANWSNVGPTGVLLAGQGFTLKGCGAITPTQNYTFVGKPNSGLITSPIAANKLNLSGNPYPSAIDSNLFITANNASTTGTIYFWEHFSTNTSHNLIAYQGGYATRNLVGGAPPIAPAGISGQGSSSRIPARYIPVGQGFFVSGSAAGGIISFDNSQRLFVKEDNASSNIMFREAPVITATTYNNHDDAIPADTYGRIRLGFNSSSNFHRQILLGFMDGLATSGVDVGYDAPHIDVQPNDMYFMIDGSPFVIQGDSYFNVANVYNLGVKTESQGLVTFVLDGTENFSDTQNIYIYDNITGIYHDIRSGNFQVDLPAGVVENRFSLRFNNGTLGVNNFDSNNEIAVAFSNADNMITIRNNRVDTEVKSVTLFNILGQAIDTWDVKNRDQSKIQIPVKNIAAGTYIVKAQTTEGEISKKIIVK